MALQLSASVPLDRVAPAARGRAVAVSLRGLTKDYGDKRVLHGIDLDITPGEFVGVVGRSGCGKSTLLRLLAGLEPATAGEVRLGGDGPPLSGLNQDCRVMFQDARLLPWKRVRDNAALGLTGRDARARAEEALEHVGLGDRGGDWPAILSGGQKQRVALARALAAAPRLLLLDEPMGALDALTRIEMQALVERVWREAGFTALLVTHDVEEAVELCDRILLIEEGRIALDVPVPLSRPRDRASAEFAALKGKVLSRLLAPGGG